MAVANNWNKFLLLMWKNYLLKRRNLVRTLFEVLFPVLIVGIVFILYSMLFHLHPKSKTLPDKIYSPFSIETLNRKDLEKTTNPNIAVRNWKLAYSPRNKYFDSILTDVTQSLKLDEFIGLESSEEVEALLSKQQLVAGIVFQHPSNISALPKDLSYSLRFPTGRDDRNADDGPAPRYSREGFVQIQDAIARSFVKSKSPNIKLPTVLLQQFPLEFQNIVRTWKYFILFSYVFMCLNTVRAIVTEKENQLNEMMKIMGLSSMLQWASWFTQTMISLTISTLLIVVMLLYFLNMNGFMLWMLFMIYGISTATFSFFLSVLFSKTSSAFHGAYILWAGSTLPYILVSFENLSITKLIFMCISPNAAMLHAMDHLESTNIWSSSVTKIGIGIIAIEMLLTSIVLFLITLYIERIFPGAYGVAKPWFFPFTRGFWFGEERQIDIPLSEKRQIDFTTFEEAPGNLHLGVGIHVQDLRKVFSNGKVAVNDMNIDMFENQIFVLLGHNGAGKSTTISMLTGMLQPTSGTALINGYDIRTETNKARSSFGLCAQNNILFDQLTVREHILFYSRLKGLDWMSAENEMRKYSNSLNLYPEKRASALSGGMKRKLSLANACCGGSKFVLCDEPSSGMDPSARRELWKILQDEKNSRTILLTTHYMDEADILGDRIAIMAEGRIKCCGSSFFLKKRFGAGYRLICVKDAGCDTSQVTRLLKQYLSAIEIDSDVGAELSYHLPNDDTSFFEKMFDDLETNMQSLHLSSFGLSLTTLEDVFHKVGTDSIVGDAKEIDTDASDELNNKDIVRLLGFALVRNHCYAMFKKKYFYWKRNWITYAILNILTVFLLAYLGYNIQSQKGPPDTKVIPPRPITLTDYEKSEIIMDLYSPPVPDSSLSHIMHEYERLFTAKWNNAKLVTLRTYHMNEYFLDLSKRDQDKVNTENLAGVSFNGSNENTIIAWFNGHPLHTAPLTLNLVHNAIVKAMIGADHSIELYNHPAKSDFNLKKNPQDNSMVRSAIAFFLGLPFAVLSATYITSYIKERSCKSKLLLFITGVNPFIFWTVSFLWDFLTYCVTFALIIITCVSFQIPYWSSPGEVGITIVVLLAFGFATLPMNYVFSLLFKSPSSGLIVMVSLNVLMGFFAHLILTSLKAFFVIQNWAWIFLLFPHYAFITSFHGNSDSSSSVEASNAFAWEEPGIGRNLTFMFAMGIFYITVLTMCEQQIFRKLFFSMCNYFRLKYVTIPVSNQTDIDVLKEKERVNELLSSTQTDFNNLILHNLTHIYGTFVAVNRLSLAIEPLECFGLLGVNGAGKTTTFKMLTGDKYICDGDAWVHGVSVKNNLSAVHKLVAYCPQFDALFDDLTCRETLEIFGLLNGIQHTDIATVSVTTAIRFDFMKHIDKLVSQLSGGTKRKLSVAIAFLGPSVVYLDEPTAGLDPGARRRVWNIISKERSSGKTIVLTTHNMDECEALCSRVAIMARGEFQCLGSMQHLKNKFSEGYELKIKVTKLNDLDDNIQEEIRKINEYVAEKIAGATLTEVYQELLTFYVPPSNESKWSKMFGIVELAKTLLPIEDYSIQQTSLDQIFYRLAKTQSK